MGINRVLSGVVIGIGIFLELMVHAEASNMNYSVQANIPANQLDKTKTFFDLRMKSGEKQIISLTLKNKAGESATILVEPNRATTNRNGVINYGASNDKPDNSLEVNFEQLISSKKEVKLARGEEKKVDFTLQMPARPFSGMVLGGFYVHKKEANPDTSEAKKVQVKNDFSYVIGVKLTESDEPVTPDLRLNEVKPGLENYQTMVSANIQNTAPTILSDLHVEAQVLKRGEERVLHSASRDNQAMAPNSNYDFTIPWDGEKLTPGKYLLRLKAHDGAGHKWDFRKGFVIREKDEELNKEALLLPKEQHSILKSSLIAAGGLVAVVGILMFFVIRSRKRSKS
ncbi:DUF916 and DUF3324 domain-containing protein [Listeria valentina]|uniref:DUF916 and DUF3324 domain-containing protein n=1 Tax=Listeria valentina TaxID=2705293 RepID=UPI001431634C|nr:DUF916 and DUF3324 domain-containing protein [Listeria valentina]